MQTTGLDHLLVAGLPLLLEALNLLFARVFQPAQLRFPIATQHNIGTPASHVGCHRYVAGPAGLGNDLGDRKSTRLNSSHVRISYAVFCLKKKTQPRPPPVGSL